MSEHGIDPIRVGLAGQPYDVFVAPGLLDQLGAHVRAVSGAKQVAIITDRNVGPLYLERARASLKATGLGVHAIALEPGEHTKSFAGLADVLDQLLNARIERSDMLIALGGGVIGDLTGLAASLLRRGVPFVQCPTTLLAQVDSSVGGKTGIDTRHGKNLVGSFYQPARVLADTALLQSLPKRELRAGYAEVVKYGLINNSGFFDWCEADGHHILNLEAQALQRAVMTSISAKARIVVADEREQGERALLNLGHTFGHALEAETGYGQSLLHGEAIAIGMCLAFLLSVRLNLAPRASAERVIRHFTAIGLPTRIDDVAGQTWSAGKLLDHMMQDKKKAHGKLALILVRGIGQAFVTRDVELPVLKEFLEDAISAPQILAGTP